MGWFGAKPPRSSTFTDSTCLHNHAGLGKFGWAASLDLLHSPL